ncbi:MAG: extradiol ring-cleavage dioxygenase [Rhodospirillaceae bacterium]|nr:extradiol ring-cleavage dioxygenase [Rhodospirillaceae bacterium]
MPLVFAGVCSHAPGITGRADRADPVQRENLYKNFDRMRIAIEASEASALIVIGAEHFANFFMDNMPAFCVGMGAQYRGPIEEEDWLGIKRHVVPGAPDLSRQLITEIMSEVDVSYAEEWQFDHGIMVPLHFLTPRYDLPIIPVNINCQGPPLTPLHRAWVFGRALRRACDTVSDKIAVIGTGGISHWPATPDSGKINEKWDRQFLDHFIRNDREALLSYTDEETYRDGGQGGFEIRTFIAVAGASNGVSGEVWCYEPIPIFAVGCTIAVMNVEL